MLNQLESWILKFDFGGIGAPLVTNIRFGNSNITFRWQPMCQDHCWYVNMNVDGRVERWTVTLKVDVESFNVCDTKNKVEEWNNTLMFAKLIVNCQVECCDPLWFLAWMELHNYQVKPLKRMPPFQSNLKKISVLFMNAFQWIYVVSQHEIQAKMNFNLVWFSISCLLTLMWIIRVREHKGNSFWPIQGLKDVQPYPHDLQHMTPWA